MSFHREGNKRKILYVSLKETWTKSYPENKLNSEHRPWFASKDS